jgi:transmembrane sensor
MGNLLHFPDRRKIKREASLWLVSIDEGLTEDESRQFEEWLAADPRHPQALAKLADLWGAFDALSELATTFPLERYRPRRSRPRLRNAVAIAATAAGVAAVGWYVSSWFVVPATPDPARVALPDARNSNDAQAAAAEGDGSAQRSYQTVIGEQLSARLPDASLITLNTDTLLEVNYSASERLVTVRRGEASFNVAADAARPFRVLVGTTMVQAVGTIFNVQLGAQDRIEVTVSEGKVRVTSAQRPPAATRDTPAVAQARQEVDMTVAAGELAVIDGPEEAVRQIDALEIEARLAWHQGMLIFRGSPLETVVADVSRYTNVKFTIADDSIRSTRVGGYFRAGDIDALLVALEESFGIQPTRVGDEIILTARD